MFQYPVVSIVPDMGKCIFIMLLTGCLKLHIIDIWGKNSFFFLSSAYLHTQLSELELSAACKVLQQDCIYSSVSVFNSHISECVRPPLIAMDHHPRTVFVFSFGLNRLYYSATILRGINWLLVFSPTLCWYSMSFLYLPCCSKTVIVL